MKHKLWIVACYVCVFNNYLVSATFAAATVNYSGYVYSDFGFNPAFNGFAIAGTFAPGFDPFSYHCYYGDENCNLDRTYYSDAVSDGNFIPIGTGDVTDLNGFFSGSGMTSAAAGAPIFFLAFDTPAPDDAINWGNGH